MKDAESEKAKSSDSEIISSIIVTNPDSIDFMGGVSIELYLFGHILP